MSPTPTAPCAPAWPPGLCLRRQAPQSPRDSVCLLPSSFLPAPNTFLFPAANVGPHRLLACWGGVGGSLFSDHGVQFPLKPTLVKETLFPGVRVMHLAPSVSTLSDGDWSLGTMKRNQKSQWCLISPERKESCLQKLFEFQNAGLVRSVLGRTEAVNIQGS